MTINRLLVANRGEIARRVFATCRRLGIETVAVHSDADAELPFVREAGLAVRLPGDTPAETYLRGDLVIEAARSAGADAVHPGYGFLSENAGFARDVAAAGLVWIGPDPESIEAMGSKIAAKKLMADAGVPVFDALEPSAVTEADLPVLVKASAGGGGRGMRIVRSLPALPQEVAGAEAEAASAFGDGTVFVEPYLEHGRHVEVQVVGDRHGGVIVLGERDCSLQRRHQKVVEEAPAPGLSDDVRRTLHEAARNAATAIRYVGAGTVEFMVSTSGAERVFFLEMNTRLQVEHPVTEAVFGIDLVEVQIAVAEGASVESCAPRRAGARPEAHDLQPEGHAIEVRLYAEDPSADYQPQSGRLEAFEIPDVDVEFGRLPGPGLRLDSGFAAGNEVGTHYDAMLAKVVAWAPTREQAARRLAGALSRSRLHGLTTNRDLLVASLRHPAFLDGGVSTDFFDVHPEVLGRAPVDAHPAHVAAALALAEHDRARSSVQPGVPVAWRNVTSQPQRTRLLAGDDEVEVEWWGGRDGYLVDGIDVLEASPTHVVLVVDGVRVHSDVQIVTREGSRTREVYVDGPLLHVRVVEVPRFVDPADVVAQGSLLAPMPGTVIGVPLEVGASVTAGQPVLVLEAMKMQHTISAPTDGVLTEVAVALGQQVSSGEVLAVVTDQTSQEAEENPR